MELLENRLSDRVGWVKVGFRKLFYIRNLLNVGIDFKEFRCFGRSSRISFFEHSLANNKLRLSCLFIYKT